MSTKNIPAGLTDNVQVPDNEELKQISHWLELQQTAEKNVADLTEQLEVAKKDLKRLSEEIIPDAMLSLGLSGMQLADGSEVEIKRFYSASISEEHKKEAFKWLRQNKHDGIIKSEVVSKFGRGEQSEMHALTKLLREHQLPFQQKDTVHHATLKAFVKEKLEAGENLPTDLFGVFVGNRTVIKTK